MMARTYDYPSAALPTLPWDQYRATWEKRKASNAIAAERPPAKEDLSAGIFLSRSIPPHQRADCGYGHECQRDSGHRARLACQPHHGYQGTQKKAPALHQVNQTLLASLHPEQVAVEICSADELDQRRGLSSELDEMWSYVGKKANQHWLWHAIDHYTGKVLAYVFGRRKDTVFLQLLALLKPFGITRYYTDSWGAYERHVDAEQHTVGKEYMQRIESKYITCGPGSSGWCAGRSAFPRPSRCTIWSSDSSSTGMSLGESSNMRSTTLKHPPLPKPWL